jgi:hypothetical protein
MSNDGSKRALVIISILMMVAIGGSAILPLLTNQNQNQQATQPTPTLAPTLPVPLTDFSSVKFDQDYLHSSGLFSVAQPTGWTIASPVSNSNGAEITMNNGNLLSVIQVSLQIAGEPIDTLDKLDALYTSASLNSSWSYYRRDPQTGLNYRETDRKRSDNQIILDFQLQNNRQQTFLARQVAWADGMWVYSVRVVMPENAIDALKFMVDSLVPTVKGYPSVLDDTPPDWNAYFDPTVNYIIRYPSTWIMDDGGPGRPTSFSGDNAVLRVETLPGVKAEDEAAARAWVEASRAGVSIVSVKPATRGEVSGFSVSYKFSDADGNPQSGAALLLNGADGLHVANLRVTAADVDFNADGLTAPYDTLAKILETFQPLAGVNVPVPTPTPTPTLVPVTPTEVPPTATATLTPTVTFTPAPTDTEVIVEVTLEVTEPPQATATKTPTLRPTARPTVRPTSTPTVEATPEATAGS